MKANAHGVQVTVHLSELEAKQIKYSSLETELDYEQVGSEIKRKKIHLTFFYDCTQKERVDLILPSGVNYLGKAETASISINEEYLKEIEEKGKKCTTFNREEGLLLTIIDKPDQHLDDYLLNHQKH